MAIPREPGCLSWDTLRSRIYNHLHELDPLPDMPLRRRVRELVLKAMAKIRINTKLQYQKYSTWSGEYSPEIQPSSGPPGWKGPDPNPHAPDMGYPPAGPGQDVPYLGWTTNNLDIRERENARDRENARSAARTSARLAEEGYRLGESS
eukprot:GHVU01080842.1.p2 GENE.GHVU01080842.1~~GHVU01080842.1.p2  ORF type:complete len:156 (-),score=5.43 GHVU01080842.1:247-693(-)